MDIARRGPGLAPLSSLRYLRTTSLRRFEDCPFTWAAEWLAPEGRKEDEKTGYAAIGTAAHSIIEHHLADLGVAIGSIAKNDELAGLLREAALAAWEVVPVEEHQNLLRYLQSLADLVMKGNWGPFALEHEFLMAMADGMPPVKGHIDCLLWNPDRRQVMVLDHKTNRRYDGHEHWKADIQPAVYSWAVRQLYPGPEIRFRVGYVNIDTAVEWDVPRQDTDSVPYRVYGMWNDMLSYEEAGEWPRTVNDRCGWCRFNRTCPATAGAMERLRDSFLEVAGKRTLGEQREWLRSIAKSAAGMLAEVEDELRRELVEGPKRYGGLVYSLKTGETRRSSYSRVMERINSHNHEAKAHDLAPGLDLIPAEVLDSVFTVKVTGLDALERAVPALKGLAEAVTWKERAEVPTITARPPKELE